MAEQYNVFISWSGDGSKHVAEAIHEWLPFVLQAAKPWLSSANIDKGSRGLNEISSKLQEMKVGIVCLTPDNLAAPWILYEAGALSKTISDKARLCTYLLGGLKFQDVEYPLAMFQATNSDKTDTRKLLSTINSAVSDDPIPEGNLTKLFEKWWPELEAKIATMPKVDHAQAQPRKTEELIAEILELARAEAQNRESLQKQISRVEAMLRRAPFGPELTWGKGKGKMGKLSDLK